MKNELSFRAYQKEDAQAIESMIREAWHYDDLCSSKTAGTLAKVFLSSCLCNQTYTQVALLQDQPIGVIMAKNSHIHHCPLAYRLKQLYALLSLLITKEGRKVMRVFSSVNHIDQDLLKECTDDYQGELAFFVISQKARGKGVGNQLFQSALHYMQSQNINSFYLYTDTSCNYGFYEHQGLQRRCQKDTSFLIEQRKASMTFYLYDYQLTKK